MSPNRWKVLACAIFSAAFCATDTANPPLTTGAPRVVVAITPVKTTPPVVYTVSAPIIAAENPPTITVAAIPPLFAPPAVRAAKSVPAPRIVAANPPDVTHSSPAVTGPKNPTVTVAPSVAAVTPPAADSERPLPFDRRILAAHNRERQDLGLQPLSWNPALAQSAQRWAEHLAETGRFEHAPENHVAPEGENLWAGTRGYYTPEAMVAAWIREKRYFRTGVFPDNSTTGRVEDIGHYTQVVWRATHEVGCAEAASANEDILVCRYAEAGNYRGERPF